MSPHAHDLPVRSHPHMSKEVQAAYASCGERLKNHRTHLLSAARTLEDTTRRDAFFAAYLSLRVHAPACLPRPLGRARSLPDSLQALRAWSDTARLCNQGQPDPGDPAQVALADAMTRFQIPMTPWVNLEAGLGELARNEPPRTMIMFFDRSRNLALAPSAVFVRILCSRQGVRRYRMAKELDVDELSHDPAMFAYLVGVIADVFNELDDRKNGHSSIPQELLMRHNLSVDDLKAMRGEERAPERFLSLMQDMSLLAWKFYDSGVAKLTQAASQIPPQAVHHLDGFLDQFKTVLRNLEKTGFSPQEFTRQKGSLEPRISLGVQAPGFSADSP